MVRCDACARKPRTVLIKLTTFEATSKNRATQSARELEVGGEEVKR